MTNKRIDTPSYSGQFGWERIGSGELAVPVIVRSHEDGNIRYSPVRIVEQEIIKKYESLPQSIFQCITLKSYYLTAIEAKLLNHINFNHCDTRYGETCFNQHDVIINATDIKELSRFLNISCRIFSHNSIEVSNYLGIIRLQIDPDDVQQTFLVPYLIKLDHNRALRRYIPLRMVERYVKSSDMSIKGSPNDWDVMYLKMLSIYCRNNSQNHISKDSGLILLDGLMYSKTNSPLIYEDYKINLEWGEPCSDGFVPK